MRRAYGASPAHLAGHLALLALTAYVVARLADARAFGNILLWFVGAALLHDFVLAPGYLAIDRVLSRAPRLVNFVRVPLLVSGLLLLVWFPLILALSSAGYERVAGMPVEGYAQRWLGVSAALFAISGLAFMGRAAARRRRGGP
jgi:hypothetical protein